MADPSALAASSTTVWALLAGWFTPTSLFLFLNLVIGTIVISSRFHNPSSKHPAYPQPGHHASYSDPPPLARAPSLLDRVRSFNFSVFKFDHHAHDYHYPSEVHHHQHESIDFASRAEQAPSLLQRLKSINFTPYVFDHPKPVPEPEFAHPVDPPPLVRAPSLLQRLKSIGFSQYRYDHPSPIPEPELNPAYPEPERTSARATQRQPPPLARVPSFIERVKSINFSLYGQEEPDPAGHVDHADHQVKRVKSDTRPTGGEATERLPGKMKKSASDRSAFSHFEAEEDEGEDYAAVTELRQPETAREPGVKKKGQVAAEVKEAEEIDAKADDFINRFKQQLRLQRLDSIMRYTEMLRRGSAS